MIWLVPGVAVTWAGFLLGGAPIFTPRPDFDSTILGVFLALLAVGAVGHALATAVHRRRHDMAVLRALGLTHAQVRTTVAWQATTLAAVGLIFGIPLGLALARTLWRVVAERTGQG